MEKMFVFSLNPIICCKSDLFIIRSAKRKENFAGSNFQFKSSLKKKTVFIGFFRILPTIFFFRYNPFIYERVCPITIIQL